MHGRDGGVDLGAYPLVKIAGNLFTEGGKADSVPVLSHLKMVERQGLRRDANACLLAGKRTASTRRLFVIKRRRLFTGSRIDFNELFTGLRPAFIPETKRIEPMRTDGGITHPVFCMP